MNDDETTWQQLHDDWKAKKAAADELSAGYISRGTGPEFKWPPKVLTMQVLEELAAARKAEQEAWMKMIDFARRPL
jgi:hypothetical protein